VDPELEAKKRASTAQLLFKCARLVNERALARVAEKGGGAARPAHTALFPHVPLDGGIRLTELASKVGITKQAVGQLVDELEAMGLFERVPDETDARAKLVRFTARGRRELHRGLAVLAEVEEELAVAVGRAKLRALHEALLALHDHLVREAESPAAPRR
jgi:DNA-binding MarR family transcriptional regulator